MTLLDVMVGLADELQLTIVVAHVDHGIRADAYVDADLVQATCSRRSVPCIILTVDVPAHAAETGLGLEGAGRELRYAALGMAASTVSATVIATAHTMDDTAETLLMHLARGTGLAGHAAMAACRPTDDGHTLLRPMLDCRRHDIETYARGRGLVWHDDPSNTDERFLRNRVRHSVMPALRAAFGTGVADRLARSARLSQDDVAIVDLALAGLVAAADTDDGILIRPFTGQPDAVRRGILRRCVTRRTGLVLNQPTTDRLAGLLAAETGRSIPLGQGWTALRERTTIALHPPGAAAPYPPQVVSLVPATYVAGSSLLTVSLAGDHTDAPADPTTMVVDTDAVRGRLAWRPWRAGDRLHPTGMSGSKLVSDILHDAHVPHRHRSSAMVLADDDGVLWVCGLRRGRRAMPTTVTPTTLFLQQSTITHADSEP